MGFQVYLGADMPCPEIPYIEPSDGVHLNLFVQRAQMAIEGLEKLYQYHAGGMSCECGFANNFSARDSGESTLNNHTQLSDYLERCLQDAETIEVFSCWSGDEHKGVTKERQITVEDTRDPNFYFEEHQRTLVFRDHASLEASKSNAEGR